MSFRKILSIGVLLALLPGGAGLRGQELFQLFPADLATAAPVPLRPTADAFTEGTCASSVLGSDASDGTAPQQQNRLLDRKTVLWTAGLLSAIPIGGYLLWWKGKPLSGFHFQSEGWFGRNTYSGGSDKTSHILAGYFGFQVLNAFYGKLGHSAPEARGLSLAVTILGGTLVELGDGLKYGGASWEDIAADSLGALAGFGIKAKGWDDLIGLRFGWVPTRTGNHGFELGGIAEHYSQEIYSADLKLAGLFKRSGRNPGVARFFLLSFTYGTKGYALESISPEQTERNVGADVGLNLPEVLRALGLRDDTWWGKPILIFLTYYRVPFTSFGYRYDLNHHRWNGPDTGQGYNPR